ncbi:MAG TPA: alpha/beta hydrolase-fold protein [Armatimonadota bacterium]
MRTVIGVRAAVLLAAVVTPYAAAQNQAPPGPPPGPRSFAAPKAGPVPLPILPALPRADDSSFYAQANVPHGTVVQATYKTSSGQEKRMHVYLPPGYEKGGDARYPVLYLNHGGGDDDSKWTSTDPQGGGFAQLILDNLIAAGKARPMIAVMPNTRGTASPTPTAPGKDDACAQEYVKDIIPYVDAHYRTRASREGRALAGLSMGGFVVMNVGLPHLDTFGELYVYSSGYFPNQLAAFEEAFGGLFDDPRTQDQFRVPLYMAAGETDIALPNSLKTLAVMNKHGLRTFWVLSSGGHEWMNWRRYLWQTAQVMFPQDVGGSGITVAPSGFDARRDAIEHGKLETVEYDSKSVGIKRRMVVYTPPGYSSGTKYPVLYLLHGIGDTEVGWTSTGAADVILDNLLADKKAVPMIVVMPNGRASKDPPPANPFEGNPFEAYGAFDKDLLGSILPYMETHYSVQADPEHRALAGLSMGGGQSLNFGLANLDTFAWVGGFSSAPNTKKVDELVPDPAAAKRKLKLLWVSCGDQDGLMNISKPFHEGLETMRVPHIWHVDSGRHEWPVWRNDLYLFAQRIFR